jgi:hypothetical protein
MLEKLPIRIEQIAAGTLLICFMAGGLCSLTASNAADITEAAPPLVSRVHKSDRLSKPTLGPSPITSSSTEVRRTPLGCDRAFSPIADPARAHIVRRCIA